MLHTPKTNPLKPGANPLSPGFLVRIAAIFYDLLLLIAILMAATALLLPFNSGEAATPAQLNIYRLYLLAVSFVYYGWFWTHGGQTLGLKTWKIRVLTLDRQTLTWKQAALRFIAAAFSWTILGFGVFWILFDKNKFSWYDRLSKTAVFYDRPKTQ